MAIFFKKIYLTNKFWVFILLHIKASVQDIPFFYRIYRYYIVFVDYLRGGEVVRQKFKIMSMLFAIGMLASTFAVGAETPEGTPKHVRGTSTSEGARVVKNKNSISVPGYAWINFVADQEEQVTPLRNPIQNDCYFKITMVLEDGTEIWKSDYMEPGEKAEHIKLLQTLPEGTYQNVTLKYDCFSLNNKSALNNARIKLKLVVNKK